jgi:hypothetical protein
MRRRESVIDVVAISVVLSVCGYVVGVAYGRSDERNAWRTAVERVPNETCRYALRDAIRLMRSDD